MNKKLVIEWSFDDGLKDDFIIAELFNKYGFTATFYISDFYGMTDSDIKRLSSMGMEIGGHTVSHFQDMKLLDEKMIKYEINENKRRLENIVGKEITKFAFPRGRHNKEVDWEVAKAGYKEARTTLVLKTETGGFIKDTTLHFYPRKEYDNKNPFDLAKQYVRNYKEGEVLRFWGHSSELLKFYKIEQLEELLKFINKYA